MPSSTDHVRWEALPDRPDIPKASFTDIRALQTRVDHAITTHIAPTYQDAYRFHVFRSPSQQVIHIAGKNIYIPTGLMELAPSDATLAFIIAHEIAHWENGDIRNNRAKIPISPGQVIDAECAADTAAFENILAHETPRAQIRAWLEALKISHHRNASCESPSS